MNLHKLVFTNSMTILYLSQESPHEEEEKEQSCEKPSTVIGEGGITGDFPPETSVVFATLEACLCAIVKHLPALNPSSMSTGFQPPAHMSKFGSSTFDLIADVMVLMVDLVELCSPIGKCNVQ